MPQLPQSLHSDAYGGGRHDDAHEHSFIEFLGAHSFPAVKAAVKHITAEKGHRHPHAGHSESNGACFEKILDVRFQACQEHEEHYADLRHPGEKIILGYKIQHAGADDKPCDDFAHYLGRMELPGQKAETLGCHYDDGKLLENFDCFHICSPASDFRKGEKRLC